MTSLPDKSHPLTDQLGAEFFNINVLNPNEVLEWSKKALRAVKALELAAPSTERGPVAKVIGLNEIGPRTEWYGPYPAKGTLLYSAPVSATQDTARLDWLALQAVSVRTPLAHGSKHAFLAVPEYNDGQDEPSPIRGLIDAAMGFPDGKCHSYSGGNATSDLCSNCGQTLFAHGLYGTKP